jgi:hypothetical protein
MELSSRESVQGEDTSAYHNLSSVGSGGDDSTQTGEYHNAQFAGGSEEGGQYHNIERSKAPEDAGHYHNIQGTEGDKNTV